MKEKRKAHCLTISPQKWEMLIKLQQGNKWGASKSRILETLIEEEYKTMLSKEDQCDQ